jgi:hypothetical protein
VPVLFGTGTRMFENLGDAHITLEPLATIQTPRAAHVRLPHPPVVKDCQGVVAESARDRPRAGDYARPNTKVPLMRNDEEIRALLTRLSRRHPSGGTVIERAAIVADGADSAAVVAWILDHAGEPEAAADTSSKRGLHSPRLSASMGSERAPARYVLPAGALN